MRLLPIEIALGIFFLKKKLFSFSVFFVLKFYLFVVALSLCCDMGHGGLGNRQGAF